MVLGVFLRPDQRRAYRSCRARKSIHPQCSLCDSCPMKLKQAGTEARLKRIRSAAARRSIVYSDSKPFSDALSALQSGFSDAAKTKRAEVESFLKWATPAKLRKSDWAELSSEYPSSLRSLFRKYVNFVLRFRVFFAPTFGPNNSITDLMEDMQDGVRRAFWKRGTLGVEYEHRITADRTI